jgi:glycosyltransferase 2 family protein
MVGPVQDEPPAHRFPRRLVALLKAALLLLVLGWVGSEVRRRVGAVDLQQRSIAPGWIAASAVLALLANALVAPLTLQAQHALGVAAGWRAATVAMWGSASAKYLPGKVGALLGAVVIYRSFGVAALDVVGLAALSAVATFAAASLLLLPAALDPRLAGIDAGTPQAWAVLATCAACAVLGLPAIGMRLLQFALRMARRVVGASVAPAVLHPLAFARLVAITLLQTILLGGALWCAVVAQAPIAPWDAYGLTVALLVSGLAGLFAFFAPAGLGVREGLMLALLANWDKTGEIAVAVVLLRAFQVAADGLLTVAGTVMWRQRSMQPARDADGPERDRPG